jgi:hypothetical protein
MAERYKCSPDLKIPMHIVDLILCYLSIGEKGRGKQTEIIMS